MPFGRFVVIYGKKQSPVWSATFAVTERTRVCLSDWLGVSCDRNIKLHDWVLSPLFFPIAPQANRPIDQHVLLSNYHPALAKSIWKFFCFVFVINYLDHDWEFMFWEDASPLTRMVSLARHGPQVTAATARTNRGWRPSLTSPTSPALRPPRPRLHPPRKTASTPRPHRGCTSGPSSWVSAPLKVLRRFTIRQQMHCCYVKDTATRLKPSDSLMLTNKLNCSANDRFSR